MSEYQSQIDSLNFWSRLLKLVSFLVLLGAGLFVMQEPSGRGVVGVGGVVAWLLLWGIGELLQAGASLLKLMVDVQVQQVIVKTEVTSFVKQPAPKPAQPPQEKETPRTVKSLPAPPEDSPLTQKRGDFLYEQELKRNRKR